MHTDISDIKDMIQSGERFLNKVKGRQVPGEIVPIVVMSMIKLKRAVSECEKHEAKVTATAALPRGGMDYSQPEGDRDW